MHARIDQLLSLRDGEPLAAATRAHIEQCAVCDEDLRLTRERRQALRELPLMVPPNIEFADIQARLSAPQQAAPRSDWRMAAAVIAAGLVGFLMLERSEMPLTATTPTTVPAPAPAVERRMEEGGASVLPSVLPVTQLVAESRVLDGVLQQLPPPRQVQRVSFAATVDRLEQRVQWIDMQLSSDAASDGPRSDEFAHQLWRERVDLMDSLVKVRYAESLPTAF